MFKLTPRPYVAPINTEIEPVPYKMKRTTKILSVFDTETDPFEFEKEIWPFTCHFSAYVKDLLLCDIDHFHYSKDGIAHAYFWGDDCIEQFFEWLGDLEGEFIVYVHNGGNFDFFFTLDFMDRGTAPFIINGRLVRIYQQGQEFRDSYSLIPVALEAATKGAKHSKQKISYEVFVRDIVFCIKTQEPMPARECWKDEILDYQEEDCSSLLDLVSSAHELFGDKLTMASIALPMLRSYHGFENMSERIDDKMRSFYFGGRNECFEIGRLEGDWKIYDVNSMYPFVMANERHPISATPHYENRITERTDFAYIRAWSNGALPVRADNGGLNFPIGNGHFYASIHEINAGLETGNLRISKVEYSVYFDEHTSFTEFVNDFYNRRLEADRQGDSIRKLFWKLVLNSSYGKLAQDPRKYENFLFDPDEPPSPWLCLSCSGKQRAGDRCEYCQAGTTSPFGWRLHTERGSEVIYSRPANQNRGSGFYNVAAAASITGAARAYLLRGLNKAARPIYCDTDSIICERLDLEQDPSKLGAWKLEATGNVAAIGGKKLYAVFDGSKPIKVASKGAKLTPREIELVCSGHTVEYKHPVPKFQLDGETKFITRNIRATGNVNV